MHRAYSVIEITKDFDQAQRRFAGIATSPRPDRVKDVIDSEGVTFAASVPLLLYHDKKMPVGEARFGKPGSKGTPFDAVIAQIDRPGVVKDRLQEAEDSLRSKPPLIRGVSIGFVPLEEPVYIKETGGFRFPKIEVLELSMVVVPAHQDATIDVIKSLDVGLPQPGTETASDRSSSAAAVASTRVVKAIRPQDSRMKKTYTEQIREFENTRAAKTARMDEIMEKAADEARSLEEKEKEEYDGLEKDVTETDEHLKRLRAAEERMKAMAKPVMADTPHAASQSRSPVITIGADNREKGIGFARVVMAKMAAFMEARQGNYVSAPELAKAWWPSDQTLHQHLEAALRHKTAVNAGTTQHSTWAAPLVYADNLTSEFIDYLRPMTIIGKFGTNGIPALRSVPFNVRIPRATSGMTGYWVGEGKPKPVTSAALDSVTLTYTKVAAITVITQELARFSSPSAEAYVRDELAKAVVAKIDTSFIDPALAASSYVNPASITNGLTALTSAGTSADSVITDLQNLLEGYILNNLDTTDLVLIMPNTLALVLSLMTNTLGNREFPDMTVNGGRLRGIPVIASQYAASGASFGNMVIAVKAGDVALADDGRVSVDVSGEASLQMDDAPTNESASVAATTVVSMFQTNSLAVRAEREVHWAKLRSTAVVYMDDVNWGAIGSPA